MLIFLLLGANVCNATQAEKLKGKNMVCTIVNIDYSAS